jgi:archaellum biogenesis ATPase FlaH
MERMEGVVVGAMNLMGRMNNAGKSVLKTGFGFGWCMILVKDMVKTITGFQNCITCIGMGR